MSSSGNAALSGFKTDYDKLFVKEWSPYVGAMLLMLIILGLMVTGSVWGVFGGVKFWGDKFNQLIGLAPLLDIREQSTGFLTHRMSLMNIMLVIGAFSAALLSQQFKPNLAPKIEYVWGAAGGTLLGIGAALAGGCTTGGFFNPVLHSSPAGWAMWLGLIGGAAIGFKLLLWTMENIDWGSGAPPSIEVPLALKQQFPWLGLIAFLGVLVVTAQMLQSDDSQLRSLGFIVVFGFLIGFVMHRSRLCFARAFREPFVTAEGQMTKAVILALAIGIPLAALLFEKKIIDPYSAIPATFWIGSLLGGLIFGIGMVFAGGCASGSLWRMGEGHIKLWVTMFFFSWSGSTAAALFKKFGLTSVLVENDADWEVTAVGFQAYFPEMFGAWSWSLLIGGGLLLLWYALVRYNESTDKFTLL